MVPRIRYGVDVHGPVVEVAHLRHEPVPKVLPTNDRLKFTGKITVESWRMPSGRWWWPFRRTVKLYWAEYRPRRDVSQDFGGL